jgi:hypothetical protein
MKCDTIQSGRYFPSFRRNLMSSVFFYILDTSTLKIDAAVSANHLYISAGPLDLISQKTGRKKMVNARLFKYDWVYTDYRWLPYISQTVNLDFCLSSSLDR